MINIGSLSIEKLYLGATEVPKAYLGDVQVYGSSPTPTIQKIHVNWTDCQYVTDYVPNGNSVIEFKMTLNQLPTSGIGIYGEYGCGNTQSGSVGSYGHYSRQCFCINWAGTIDDYAYPYVAASDAQPITVRMSKDGYTFDGTTISFSGNSPTSNDVLRIGCRNATGSDFIWTGDIYYIKIWENGVLVRDYEPTTNNNIPVLEDSVTGNVTTYTIGDTSKVTLVTV